MIIERNRSFTNSKCWLHICVSIVWTVRTA